MIDLSVVVPVYNVEKYFDCCVKSIIFQTLKEIEIILVDDGSTDSSGIMCDSWAKKDDRIKVIHKKNGGLMSAWKAGVVEATGKYIGFVDSDDWVDSTMFEQMLNAGNSYNADLVCTSLVAEYSDGNKIKELLVWNKPIYTKEEIKSQIFPVMLYNPATNNRGLSPSRVTKIYKREILIQILDFCSNTVSIGEDLLTTFSFMTKANSIAFIQDFHPYHYRINTASMIQTYSITKYDKIKELKICLEKANEASNYDFSEQINNDFIQLMLQQLDCEILFSNSSFRELCKRCRIFYTDISFNKALKNANIKKLSKKNKLYLWLLKNHMYYFLLVIRKSKKVKVN